MSNDDPRRRLPQVSKLLDRPAVREAMARFGRAPVERSVRAEVARLRDIAVSGEASTLDRCLGEIDAAITSRSARESRLSLRRVINATGVVVHTNLGRAPLPREVAEHVSGVASSYTNLEYDIDRGERGHRETHAEARLRAMLGAEASVVVNNNAASVLLAVNTLAEGRDVLVSRGELVEIGGSFRIPDIVLKSGARLREVGTTNRTRIADYADAIDERTALILRVHPSNFRIVGFTEAPSLEQLTTLGSGKGIPVVDDLGSGLLDALEGPLRHEATIAASLAAGVDVVTASGDKLLGGPQAGIVVGRRKAVDALRKNPLYRALRVDKMTIAALDAVLAAHDEGRSADLPVPRMLGLPATEIRRRVELLRDRLIGARLCASLSIRPVDSAAGGGSAPDVPLPSFALAVSSAAIEASELERRLRLAPDAVIARVADDAVLLDLRTVFPEQEADVERVLVDILGTNPDR